MSHVRKTSAPLFPEILRCLEVRPIFRNERKLWDKLMGSHHYLGLRCLVGESIRYVAVFQEHWLALLGWSAAALKCKVRDEWIGWHHWLKFQRLPLIANNTRFLILPEIRIPNLASRILALNLKRLSQDWQAAYNHPIWVAETFVDPRYFKGICYKAAGWLFLGYTQGFAKCSHHYHHHDHPKMVFVRPLHPHAQKKLSHPYLEINLNQEVKPMKLSAKRADALIKRLLEIRDPRMPRGIRHQKLSVLAIAICALMSNARSFKAMAEWAKRSSQNMLKRLGCRYHRKTKRFQPPSEPTIRRFLQTVDAQAVDQTLSGWLYTLSDHDPAIAVDGKTLKGARQENGRPLHLLSAFLHQQGIVLAQRKVENNTNEITTLPSLLDPLPLEGGVVTLDALHTQKNTARYLVEKKHADYLFIAKDNQPNLKKDVEDLRLVDFPPSAPNHR
jgi:hypothetical protein